MFCLKTYLENNKEIDPLKAAAAEDMYKALKQLISFYCPGINCEASESYWRDAVVALCKAEGKM